MTSNVENTKIYGFFFPIVRPIYQQIDRIYCEHRDYLQTIINQMSYIKRPGDTNELISKIDRYISNNESQQLERLRELAILSKNVYGYDKTMEKYSENIELFQTFFSTKNQLNVLGENLAEDEKTKAAADELQRKQEIQKQQQQQQQLQQFQQPQRIKVDIGSAPFVQQQQQQPVYDSAPRFIRQLNDITIQEGERHQFVCQLQSVQPNVQIEWLRNGASIRDSLHYEVCNENNLCTLSIGETFTEDSALFSCRATNHLGSAETSARLFIQHTVQTEKLFPPHFIRPLTNCQIASGSSLTWKCFVEGMPLPTIQCFRNGLCIDVLPRYNISYNNGEATLRMDDLTVDDAGIFVCSAKNILGVDQCSATLTIIAAPKSIDSLVKNG